MSHQVTKSSTSHLCQIQEIHHISDQRPQVRVFRRGDYIQSYSHSTLSCIFCKTVSFRLVRWFEKLIVTAGLGSGVGGSHRALKKTFRSQRHCWFEFRTTEKTRDKPSQCGVKVLWRKKKGKWVSKPEFGFILWKCHLVIIHWDLQKWNIFSIHLLLCVSDCEWERWDLSARLLNLLLHHLTPPFLFFSQWCYSGSFFIT